jgi:hypothetical protein
MVIAVLSNRIKLNELIEWILERVVDSNDLFTKNYQIYIIFRLICHNPIGISNGFGGRRAESM